MHKKIAVVGTVGLPASYGGFETLVENLTQELGEELDFTVYCSAKSYQTQLPTYNNARLKYLNFNANGIQSIPYDILSLLDSLKNADTILVLGVSGCIVLPVLTLFTNKRIVVNIDGQEWKRQKWNRFAKWFLRFSERLAVKFADAVVTDNRVIQDYVRDSYGVESKMIAYGADHARKISLSEAVLKDYPFLKENYAFKVSRIEPENNIQIILEAFSEYPDLNLVLIGNWGNSSFGKDLKLQFGKYPNIFLLDSVYDQDILNQIRSNCYVYVHGHSAGGTNPSLVEAMYLGLPILAFGANYNKATTNSEALYFNDRPELVALLSQLETTKLQSVSRAMKAHAEENYTWQAIAQAYLKLF